MRIPDSATRMVVDREPLGDPPRSTTAWKTHSPDARLNPEERCSIARTKATTWSERAYASDTDLPEGPNMPNRLTYRRRSHRVRVISSATGSNSRATRASHLECPCPKPRMSSHAVNKQNRGRTDTTPSSATVLSSLPVATRRI